MAKLQSIPFFPLFALLSFSPGTISTTFTISNSCRYTIWPEILSGAGTPPLNSTPFSLPSGNSFLLEMPPFWSGRLWARTGCSSDPSTGLFSCATGDSPPATLAEFTLHGSDGLDFFDVSLVDGYNLPVLVSPSSAAGAGKCTPTGCAADINGRCPSDLRVTADSPDGAACRSACGAFNTPEFCCSGDYSNPDTCRPSSYSLFFKSACPRAYSYAYDDASSTFTCAAGVDYLITFCPSSVSKRTDSKNPIATGIPLINDTMMFFGPATGGAATRSGSFSNQRRIFLLLNIYVFGAVLGRCSERLTF